MNYYFPTVSWESASLWFYLSHRMYRSLHEWIVDQTLASCVKID